MGKSKTSRLKIFSLSFIQFLGLLLYDHHRTVADINSRSFAGLLGGTEGVPCPFPPPHLVCKGQQAWHLLLAWWEAVLSCTGNAFISIATICTPCTHFGNSYTGLPLPLCCRAGLHKVKYSLVGTDSTSRQQVWAEFENITGWSSPVLPHYP